jgi:hypothetical protein
VVVGEAASRVSTASMSCREEERRGQDRRGERDEKIREGRKAKGRREGLRNAIMGRKQVE